MSSDKEKVAKRYDRWSGVYDSVDTFPGLGRWEKRWRLEAIEMLALKPSDLVLDVGTGTGLIVPWLASRLKTGKVIGIDISEKMLAKARERAEKCSVADRAEFKLDDAEKMSFPDNYFDKVIATYALTTIPNPEKMVQEISRVMKPSGTFVLLDTGPPKSFGGKFVHAWMRACAKVFGYTDISRDPYKILASAPSLKIVSEKRHYATTVYCMVLAKN